MRWFGLLIVCLPLPLPLWAGACEDLWYTRNQVMDRAGYCFESTLARALFDNGDCVGQDVRLTADQEAMVADIRALEAQIGCRVNTRDTWLDLDDLGIRQSLIDLPVLDLLSGGCLGWLGPPRTLHAGRSELAPPIGRLEPGDFVRYDHRLEDGWFYVTTHGPSWSGLRAGGWLQGDLTTAACADFAG
jgi:hypothetical protein